MQICPYSSIQSDWVNLVSPAVLSIELGTVQTGIGKVDPAQKFQCTMAAHAKFPKPSLPTKHPEHCEGCFKGKLEEMCLYFSLLLSKLWGVNR